jgi:hypothetical protein
MMLGDGGKYSALEATFDDDDDAYPFFNTGYMSMMEGDNYDEARNPERNSDDGFASATSLGYSSEQCVTDPLEGWTDPTICASKIWIEKDLLIEQVKEKDDTGKTFGKEADDQAGIEESEISSQNKSDTAVETVEDERHVFTGADDWQMAEENKGQTEGMNAIGDGEHHKFGPMCQKPSGSRIEEPYTTEINIKRGGYRKAMEGDITDEEAEIDKDIGTDIIRKIQGVKLDGNKEQNEEMSRNNNDNVLLKSSRKGGGLCGNGDSSFNRGASTREASKAAKEKLGNLPRHLKDSSRWHSTPPLIHSLQTTNMTLARKIIASRKVKVNGSQGRESFKPTDGRSP